MNPELLRRVRTTLQGLIGRPVTDQMWDFLVREQWISELQKGLLRYEDIAQRVLDLEHLGQPVLPLSPSASKRRQTRWKGRQLRIQAIAVLLADDARQRDDVRAFRDSELSGKLFKFEDATAWIRKEADAHRGR